MKHTKMIIVAAIAAMTLSLAGCGNKEQPVENTPTVTSATDSAVTTTTSAPVTETVTETTTDAEVTTSAVESVTEPADNIPTDGNHINISFEDIDDAVDKLSMDDIDANTAVLCELFEINADPDKIEATDMEMDGSAAHTRSYTFDEPIYINSIDLPILSVSVGVTKLNSTTPAAKALALTVDCRKDGTDDIHACDNAKTEKVLNCFIEKTDRYAETEYSSPTYRSFESTTGHSIGMRQLSEFGEAMTTISFTAQ